MFRHLSFVICSLLQPLIFKYHGKFRVSCGLKTDEASKKMQRSYLLLEALLSCSGYGGRNREVALGIRACDVAEALKPHYRKRNKAFNAIINAFTAPTVDEYHKRLFSCQIASKPININLEDESDAAEMREDLLKVQKENSKSNAREVCQGESMATFWTCNGCNKVQTAKDIMRCPCHTV